MERNVQIGWLLDFYAPLLTDRQREALQLKYDDDLTLSEIAEGMAISRQAVHDAIHRGESALLTWESRLNLLSRHRREQCALTRCLELLSQNNIGEAQSILNSLIDREVEPDGV